MPFKTKALDVRRRNPSPNVPHPTPPMAMPAGVEPGPSAMPQPTEPSRPRVQVTPYSEWRKMTRKESMPPPQTRAEATTQDASILHPIDTSQTYL